MKQFDFNKYLKNNPLLKENFEEQTTYSVGIYYNDYPSIGQKTEALPMKAFIDIVNKLGGTAQEDQGHSKFGARVFNVSGVNWQDLSNIWKKRYSNNKWILTNKPYLDESVEESFKDRIAAKRTQRTTDK